IRQTAVFARAGERAKGVLQELRERDVQARHGRVLRGHWGGGASTSCGRPSVISYHGAFEPTKMLRCGRMPGSSSRLPIGMIEMPRSRARRAVCEPQRWQKTVVK